MKAKIGFKDLSVHCIIGVHPHERLKEQMIKIDLSIKTDISQAVSSDKLEETVSYSELSNLCKTIAKEGAYHLLETLGYTIIKTLMHDKRISHVEITLKKPYASLDIEWAVVTLES